MLETKKSTTTLIGALAPVLLACTAPQSVPHSGVQVVDFQDGIVGGNVVAGNRVIILYDKTRASDEGIWQAAQHFCSRRAMQAGPEIKYLKPTRAHPGMDGKAAVLCEPLPQPLQQA